MKFKKIIVLLFIVCVLITGCSNNAKNTVDVKVDQNLNRENISSNISYSEKEINDEFFVVFFKNNNNCSVNLEIEIEYYDEDGSLVDADEFYYSAIESKNEIADIFGLDDISYSSYEIFIDASVSKYESFFDDIEIKDNNTGENITAQIINNSDEIIENISASIVYYLGDEIVGFDYDYDYDIDSGRNANLKFYYPTDNDYNDVEFDRYKIYINEAFSYNF